MFQHTLPLRFIAVEISRKHHRNQVSTTSPNEQPNPLAQPQGVPQPHAQLAQPAQRQAQPALPAFALSPGRFTNPAHMKQHYKATEPLDVSESFNAKSGKIRLFLAHIEDRAQRFNWQDFLTIPVGTPPVNYSLVRNYGRMSLQDIQVKAQTYVGQQV